MGVCVIAAGVAIGLRPLADNSYLTHLATGRLILDTGSVPSADPYTFTAHGTPWVVQSWLASLLYASVERLAGALGLRLLSGLVAGVLTALLWRLSRPAGQVLTRLVLVVLCVGVGGELWSERPFMLGLVALALVVLAAEGGLDPRWLMPVGWLWVNTHGSFPLGLAYLVVVAVGRVLDREPWALERRCVGFAAAGMLLGGISPVGPKLLVFPLELVQKQELLRNVIEWRSPAFDGLSQRLFLVQLMLAVVLLARRPSYRGALVVAVFGGAALLGARNLTVASLVMVPVLATAMPPLGTLRSDARNRFATVVGAVGVVVIMLVAMVRLDQPDFEFGKYPVDAVAFLVSSGVDLEEHPTAAQDIVGNYLELIYGPGRRVFYDDRFDMFPMDVSDAHLALVQVRPDLQGRLDDYDIELVIWSRPAAAAQRLIVDPDWRTIYTDETYVVVCRRGQDLGGTLGTC